MKKPRYLSAVIIGLVFGMPLVKGDPPSPEAVNPYTHSDPDGVPLAVTERNENQATPGEIAELRKEQQQAARDKDWLLRSYEQQLQKKESTDSSQEPSANLYYQLSSNKDLAKLAGLPDLDPEDDQGTLTYRTGGPQSGQNTTALRTGTGASPAALIAPPSRDNIFKPLITPLSAPEAAGLHNFYSSLPSAAVTPFYGQLPQNSATPAVAPAEDSSDLETPGLIADKNNPLADPAASELSLETLPGESIEQARAHQDSNNSLQLPLPMTADQLHKQQAATVSVPGVPKSGQTPAKTSAPAKTVPAEDPDAPIPVNQVPQISPVRPPIANPFDILNH